MLKATIGKLNEQGKDYKKFTNEWNVMQQLIDIISALPDSAEIVCNDLDIEEMNLKKMCSKITGKRLANPFEVMKEICDFYKIPVPEQLPLEVWRQEQSATSKPQRKSLLDLI